MGFYIGGIANSLSIPGYTISPANLIVGPQEYHVPATKQFEFVQSIDGTTIVRVPLLNTSEFELVWRNLSNKHRNTISQLSGLIAEARRRNLYQHGAPPFLFTDGLGYFYGNVIIVHADISLPSTNSYTIRLRCRRVE